MGRGIDGERRGNLEGESRDGVKYYARRIAQFWAAAAA
jgi:hypothetical protein